MSSSPAHSPVQVRRQKLLHPLWASPWLLMTPFKSCVQGKLTECRLKCLERPMENRTTKRTRIDRWPQVGRTGDNLCYEWEQPCTVLLMSTRARLSCSSVMGES